MKNIGFSNKLQTFDIHMPVLDFFLIFVFILIVSFDLSEEQNYILPF